MADAISVEELRLVFNAFFWSIVKVSGNASILELIIDFNFLWDIVDKSSGDTFAKGQNNIWLCQRHDLGVIITFFVIFNEPIFDFSTYNSI